MSDFLSNFVNNDEKEKSKAVEEAVKEESRPARRNSRVEKEEVEFDPTYKKRKQKKILFFSLVGLSVLTGLFFAYYQFTHVKVPNFQQKEIAKAREWSVEEGVLLKIKSTYNFEQATNKVIKQSIPYGDKIKKGATLDLTVSLGPDPDEQVILPDFASMTLSEAKAWIKKEKADNVSIIEQYNDKISKSRFIKQEAANKELNLKNYKRKDRLAVYYSKGKEIFEKDIEVPDFSGKTLTEVNEWVRKNEVKLAAEKVFSQSIPADSVVAQQASAGTKIAKQEELKVQISKGKPLIVPNYGEYTLEQARELSEKIPVVLKSMYSETVPYGHFISQNIAAGTELDEKDNPPNIEVVYSEGRPYIKDLRNSTLEGDLPKLFFETYSAKGANITYDIVYLNSEEPKGTVIEMSSYGEYLPLEARISIGISLGNIQPAKDSAPPASESNEEEKE